MDSFEHIVAEVFWAEGHWVRTSVKVNLTKEEKVIIGKASSPRPEIDVVAFHSKANRILALECKSYLDSRGVTYSDICKPDGDGTYKLFRFQRTREVVLNRLKLQFEESGLCGPDATVQLGLIAGKIRRPDEKSIVELFEQNDWYFRGPTWLRERVRSFADGPYENEVATVAAKLLRIGKLRRVTCTKPLGLKVLWDDGFAATIDLADIVGARKSLEPLLDWKEFKSRQVSDDNWSVCWPSGVEFGAQQLRRWAGEQTT